MGRKLSVYECWVTALFIFVGTLTTALVSCSRAGVQTYTVSREQIQAMAQAANIPPCPNGTYNLAGLVESSTGGGVVTVKCGVDQMIK